MVKVIIEISYNSRIKYEFQFDKDGEIENLYLDRVLPRGIVYPANYGFIPNTLAQDGDPLDVLVISDYVLLPGASLNGKILGVLIMEDEKGLDEKIICVPEKDPEYKHVSSLADLPKSILNNIQHFFEHYKDQEEGKWSIVKGYEDKEFAKTLVEKYKRD